jgi:hypothetical protein
MRQVSQRRIDPFELLCAQALAIFEKYELHLGAHSEEIALHDVLVVRYA